MTAWILTVWLCTNPGATGNCRVQSQTAFATRGECQRARLAEHRANAHVMANCRADGAVGPG